MILPFQTNQLTKLREWFLKPITITLIFLVCGIVVFHAPIEILISTTLVKYVLRYCESSIINNLILGALSFTIFMYYYIRRKAIVAPDIVILFVLLSLAYLYYRNYSPIWVFTPFYSLPSFKYFDILLLVTVLALLNWIYPKQIKSVSAITNNAFFDDEPLTINKTDELEYAPFARTIAEKIEATRLEKSFAIGINGKWGMGKTSFFNLIKANLSSDENIVIDFNSWNNNTPQALIQDFFDTLQEALYPFYSSLSSQLKKYADKLVAISDNSITQSIKTTAGIIAGDSSINSLHSEINEKLKRIDKRIIIFIDDLDRLDKYEIIEVMRLIRNTASFYNTFFLVAYDRDYVLRAVKEYNPHNYQSFLEKIFQLELNLPYFDSNIFKTILLRNLKELLPERIHAAVENSLVGQAYRIEVPLYKWVSSIRDVTRLSNSISVTIKSLPGEVYFKDFLHLQLLRLKYPSVYEDISKNHFKYFIAKPIRRSKHQYILKTVERNQYTNSKYSYVLEEHLMNNLEMFSISADSVKDIVELLYQLFDKHTIDWHGKSDHLSVVNPTHFRKYFKFNLSQGNISEEEFNIARSSTQEEFNSYISSCVDADLQFELRLRFEDIRDFSSREDFEKVILGIFHFVHEQLKSPNQSFGYDSEDLMNKLSDYDFSISRNFYDSTTASNEYRSFFSNLLVSAKFPFELESSLIGQWIRYPAKHLPLTIEELQNIVIDYFDQYCNYTDNLDQPHWELLYNCMLNKNHSEAYERYPKRAQEIFKNFILTKDIDGFILSLIKPDRGNDSEYSLTNYALYFWETWESFLRVLEQNNTGRWKYIEEFIEFYKMAESNDSNESIAYNFKTIPVKN